MRTVLWIGRDSPEDPERFGRGGHDGFRLIPVRSIEDARVAVRRECIYGVVIDLRGGLSARGDALAMLDAVEEDSLRGPAPMVLAGRTIGVIDAGATADAFALGSRGVSELLEGPSPEQVVARVRRLCAARPLGKIAVCLAGGGIEGLLYELGVIRALDAFLPDRSLADLDLFFGISAGAILASFLANGVGPAEITRGLLGQGGRVQPITRRDLFDPNVEELGARLAELAKSFVRGENKGRSFSSLTRAVPSAFFAGKRLEGWLESQLTRGGLSNSFSNTRRPLFIGATDQDTSEAVVFGDEPLRHVPISRAVRASAALVPFYRPEQIDGRYYIDGGYSRTTNMRVAVQKGATLVILVDPLVPILSREPGYVHARGGVFAGMQGLKALIHARFDKAAVAIREMYPDVAFHLFLPERDEMRILSGSPMKYFFRPEIEAISFTSTVAKIREMLPALTRDFAQHGVPFRDPSVSERRETRPSDRPDGTRSAA